MLQRYLEDVKYARPNLPGTLGAGLLHSALWTGFIANWEFGLMKILRDGFKRYAPGVYEGIFSKNYNDDPVVELCGLQDEKGACWLLNFLTAIHHGAGGGLMLYGYLNHMPWIWRHGMLIQCFGMDVADFGRMLAAKFFPPGPFPISEYMKNPPGLVMTCFHHSVSVCAGLPVCIYFSDRPAFQYYGAMCSGGPVCMVIPDLLSRFIPQEYKLSHYLMECYLSSVWTYQRIWWFFPSTWTLLKEVMSEPIPLVVKIGFGVATLNFAMFNVLVSGMFWGNIFSHAKALLTAAPGEERPGIHRTMSSTHEMVVARFSAKKELSKVYAASRLHIKAMEAREHLQSKED
eukprot:TRINITY_DN74568_c0_g1_i1.p1 TRINITY_DN74568_c0_g1~~TRINITY_DN74568_c0_g1_i1.p1  ORF type:complete len:345 (+),score=39.58 TRINITY_DN74568_c0_g1_i1:197-1231(+)